jgi:NTE family protein
MDGRYFEDLIPFFGINSVKPVSDNLLLANLELRCEVMENGYLSLIGSAYNDTPDYMAGWQENNVFAAGLKGSYDTRFGPVTANIHYCTDSRSFGAYFGFGFNF